MRSSIIYKKNNLFMFLPIMTSFLFITPSVPAIHTVEQLQGAISLRRLGKFDEAIGEIDRLISLEMKDPYEQGWALLEKGLNLQLSNRPSEGEKVLRDVILLNANDPWKTLKPSALYELARSVDKAGKFEEAEALFIEAIDLSKTATYPQYDPDLRVLMMTTRLAECYLHQGKLDDAKEMLERNSDNFLALVHRIKPFLKRTALLESVISLSKLAEVYLELSLPEKALQKALIANAIDTSMRDANDFVVISEIDQRKESPLDLLIKKCQP